MTEDETRALFVEFRERLEQLPVAGPKTCPVCGGTFETCTCTGGAA